MKTKQLIWESPDGWDHFEGEDINAQLVLFFGSTDILAESDPYEKLKEKYPNATLVGCTTAGEIIGDEVYDDSIVATAIEFEKTQFQAVSLLMEENMESYSAGKKLSKQLEKEGLKFVFIISDGQKVNGTDLVNGMRSVLGDEVILTGGLAGDGGRFEKTLVSCNTAPEEDRVAIIGFYGDAIQVGHGSMGGWDPFGPSRKITKSSSNVLYELDGKPALQLYKEYLGEKAEELPGSALLFPLMIKPEDQNESGLVRTILSVDEETQSMTFAGDVPEAYEAQLMMANFDHLVDGASQAAEYARFESFQDTDDPSLAILISCVGRKMVLGQRIGDEVESVKDIMGENTRQIGFYSYGEISPHVEVGHCQLHNQTMTITLIKENV